MLQMPEPERPLLMLRSLNTPPRLKASTPRRQLRLTPRQLLRRQDLPRQKLKLKLKDLPN
jgi:hypothetical protein